MEKKEKQRAVSAISFNIILIIFISLAIVFYMMPEQEALNSKIEAANSLYADINEIKNNGMSADGIQQLIVDQKKMTPGLQELFKDKSKVNKVIKKSGSKDYLTWVKQEVLKGAEYSKEVEGNEKIIGSILPVFYQYSDNNQNQKGGDQIREQITLDSFTNFIEEDILKKYGITSFSPVGIENISFDAEGSSTPQPVRPVQQKQPGNTIGSFTFNLDFEAKNKNIIALIDAIQKSGKLDIQNGKLMNKVVEKREKGVLSSLDNLLIGIDSITLQEPVSISDKSNKGVLKLRFYVRGVGYEQLVVIKKNITDRFTVLHKQLQDKSKLCDNAENVLCKDNVGSQAVASIRGILKEANLIKSRLDTLVKDSNAKGLDVNQTLSSWLNINSSIDTIETAYKKSSAYIDNFNKKGDR